MARRMVMTATAAAAAAATSGLLIGVGKPRERGGFRLLAQECRNPSAASSSSSSSFLLDPHGMNFPKSSWDENWDFRAPSSGATSDDPVSANGDGPLKPTATRHILLIRHGQYNLKGKTDEERHLTELGRDQASLTGKRLKELDLKYTGIIVSSMTRALETAALIGGQLSPDLPRAPPDDLLREGAPIRPEPDVSGWRPDTYYHVDGARIEAAFRKYFHRASPDQKEDSMELMVCHANVIRYFACRALQLPPEAWLRISLKHASITWITIRPNGRVSLSCLGDAGHFPTDQLTTS